MSQTRKDRFLRERGFTALATIVFIMAAASVDSQNKGIGVVPKTWTRRHGSALADRSLGYDGQSAKGRVQLDSVNLFSAEPETPTARFLPVQTRNAKALGAGKLLVASRGLGDPHFAETVILLVRYDDHGVLGLVLNRHTKVPISRVLGDFKAAKKRSDTVYFGGPVETPAVFALYKSPTKIEGADQIFGGVYLITAKPLFEKTMAAKPDPDVFHVYLGYAGWTKEQLQMEVDLGAWFIFPAEADMVFNADPDSLWQQMIRKTELKLALGVPAETSLRTGAGL